MMTQLPYVLVILFSMPGGQHVVMETMQQYTSPLSCSMRAFIENEQVSDRTFVCVTREHAKRLLNESRPVRIGSAGEMPQN